MNFKEINFNNKNIQIINFDSFFIKDLKIIDNLNNNSESHNLSNSSNLDKAIINFNKENLNDSNLIEFLKSIYNFCKDNNLDFDFKPFIEGYNNYIFKPKIAILYILKELLSFNGKINNYLISIRNKIEERNFLINSLPFDNQGKFIIYFKKQKELEIFLSFFKTFLSKNYVINEENKVDIIKNKIIDELSKKYFLTHKFYKITDITKKAEIIANIIKSGGLLSKQLRKELLNNADQGIGKLDELTGGSNYVFFRLSKYPDEDDLVFDLKILKENEHIIHDADKWGDTINDKKNRVPIDKINSTYIGEVLLKNIADIKYLKYINVKSNEEKNKLIEELKKLGINEINGKDLNEVIQVSSRNDSIKKKLMLWTFKLYNVVESFDPFRITPKIMKLIYDRL